MFWNLNPVAAAQLCSRKAPYFGSTGLNSQTFPLSHHLLALSALPPAALCLLKLHKKAAGLVCLWSDWGSSGFVFDFVRNGRDHEIMAF